MTIYAQSPPSAPRPTTTERDHRWTWLLPSATTWLSTPLYLAIFGAFWYFQHPSFNRSVAHLWVQGIGLSILVGVALLLDRIAYVRYHDTPPIDKGMLLFVLHLILIESIAQLDFFNLSPFLYLLIPLYGTMYLNTRVGYLSAVLIMPVMIGKFFWYQGSTWLTEPDQVAYVLTFTVGLLFVVGMMQVVGSERVSRLRAEHLLQALEDSHAQLRQYVDQVADLAATQERNRLARDIHDSLGHHLIAMSVQLEKAVAFRHHAPTEADHAILIAQRCTDEALRDVRQSVNALRGEPDPFLFQDALTRLVEDLGAPPLVIDLQISGATEGWPRQSLITLYRVVQEGLTNVQKHAHATHVSVHLSFSAGKAQITIGDNGDGYAETLRQQAGHGLRGMQERVTLAGGQMTLHNREGGGIRVAVWLPKRPYLPLEFL